jgi:hypothetical protein
VKKILSLISSATLRKPVEVGHLMRDHVQHMLVAVTGPTREVYLTCSLVVGLKEGAWAYAVTDRQFEQVAAIFSEEMHQPGLEPMVGVISLSVQQVIERICFAYSLGIRQFQIWVCGQQSIAWPPSIRDKSRMRS